MKRVGWGEIQTRKYGWVGCERLPMMALDLNVGDCDQCAIGGEYPDRKRCKTREVNMTDIIESSTPASDCEILLVRGAIKRADGKPVSGAIVKAFDQDLRTQQLLGEMKSDTSGHYQIGYTRKNFSRAEKCSADLMVRVYTADGAVLAESAIIFNARADEIVDLVVAVSRSEYERLYQAIFPLLAGQGVALTNLTEDTTHRDITFLSGETGEERRHIERFVLAEKLSLEAEALSRLSTEIVSKARKPPKQRYLNAEIFYGLIRRNLPDTLKGLLGQHRDILKRALEASRSNRIIHPTLSDAEIGTAVNKLRELALNQVLQPQDDQGKPALGALLAASTLPGDKRRAFADLYLDHHGPIDKFWEKLNDNPDFTDTASDLQLTFQLRTLTHYHLPLLRELKKFGAHGVLKSVRELADLDETDFKKLIEKTVAGKTVGVPPDTPGDSDAEKIGNYARALAAAIEAAEPTAVFAARFSKQGIPGTELVKENLVAFFATHPEFDLGQTYIEKYFADHSSLNGLPNRAGVMDQLKRMQRVFKLAPRFSEVRVLLEAGIHSARQIAYMGRDRFVEMFQDLLPGDLQDLELFYHRAERQNMDVALMELRCNNQYNRPQIAALPLPPREVEGVPNWATLFAGSASYCECEHCRSVYSPAAYLVNLLHFIVDRMDLIAEDGNGGFEITHAADVLFNEHRRPDLLNLQLTCKNTNTPVPYIDLVNEILENAVAPGGHDVDWPNTVGTTEELSALPEHVNDDAYNKLANEFYPWNLPWDLPLEEIRLWLRHLGVERHELMKTFLQTAGDSTDIDIAVEYLGLTRADRGILNGTFHKPNHDEPHSWEFWGLKEQDNPVPNPDNPDEPLRVGWLEALRRAGVFMQRSGLTYEQVRELFDLRFIDKNNMVHINRRLPCDLDEHRIEILNRSRLDRCHLFLRLLRKLGWTMRNLDKVITALRADNLDENFLLQLSNIKRLHDRLSVPLVNMMSWWGNIDTISYTDYTTQGQPMIPSIYERLFLDKTVIRQEPNPFILNDTGTELKSVGKISEFIPAILAALGIHETDLLLLTSNEVALQILHLPESEVNNDDLNLWNLSLLYRIVSFAKALKLSITEFLSLKAITGINPFANNASTLRFVDMVGKIRSLHFSLTEIDYLLRHVDQSPLGIAPTQNLIGLILDEIRTGLQKIAAETTFETVEVERDGLLMTVGVTPAGDLLRDKLSIVLTKDQVDTAIHLLQDATKVDNAADFIRTQFDRFFRNIEDAVAILVEHPLPDEEARFTYVLIPLYQYLRKTLSENLVTQKLGETLKLEAKTIKELLTQWVYIPEQDSQRSMDAFLADAFVDSNMDVLTFDAFPVQFKTFILLHKVSMVITKFNVKPNQLSWIFVFGPEVGWLNLQLLPLEKKHSAETLYIGMERLADLFQTRDQLPNGEETLLEIFALAREEDVTAENLLQTLSERTGWSIENLEFLTGTNGLNLILPGAFRDERALKLLNAGFATMKRLGVSAAQCRNWANPDPTINDAISAKQAVKAKYDNTQWLTVAKPVQDVLREHRRQALVAYLTNHATGDYGPFHDTNELFQHYLIDVEMSPCMMTSRIKQAIGSVQLFIQRCMMNLEPAGYPNPDGEWSTYWEWMKSYRIWEANRKVFLYPENWIEPELREDKSSFFKDLENELLQDEVTTDTVETAFRNYLEKLDAVARLEMCGMYHEVEEGVNVLHVFGRTWNEPHIYYYRRHIDATIWTAWERVDLDIQGDHLIPVVWNRRLYLFWPIFTEKAKQPEENITKDQQGELPEKYWEIQMAWCEYKNGKWSAKAMSKTRVVCTYPPEAAQRQQRMDANVYLGPPGAPKEKTDITFRVFIDSDHRFFIRSYVRFTDDLSVFSPSFDLAIDSSTKELEFDGPPQEAMAIEVPLRTLPVNMAYEEQSDEDDDSFPILIDYRIGALPVLGKTPGTFHLLFSAQDERNLFARPFFYADRARTFFVTNFIEEVWGDYLEERTVNFRFQTSYHPYVSEFIAQLNWHGIDGLLKWSMQEPILQLEERTVFSDETYDPHPAVAGPYPIEDVDIDPHGAYSIYNWELFFHAPLLIADRLSKNQRFDEAQRWFHYIFDPTDRSEEFRPQRYWKFRKFYEDAKQPIETLQDILADADKIGEQVDEWCKQPFNPHLIARMRNSAYQKTVVMKYIDNLIAWGDQLFRRETIESINEATLLYVLAAQILGARPVKLPAQAQAPKTYGQVQDGVFDALSNPEAENLFIFGDFPAPGQQNFWPADNPLGNIAEAGRQRQPKPQVITTWYLCVPPNDKLLGYWDTVADRLFKIHHCLNIEGAVRQLPLFEPPIEPGLLVRAAAAGVDISSALSDINAPLPHYRFNVMLQKAIELCNDVKSLGAVLLSALEKKDAEALALLRSTHEVQLLGDVRVIKDEQIKEATETRESLNRALEVTRERFEYYDKLVTEFAPGGLSPYEAEHLSKLRTAYKWQERAGEYEQSAQWASLIPNITFGTSGYAGTPVMTATIGGNLIVLGYQAQARRMQGSASEATYEGTRSSIMGSYVRRLEEWQHQKDLSDKELTQIDKQIAAADLRKQIAEKELENHDKQIENAREVDEYLRSKYTNPELYQWQVGQISGVYFQSYKLAYDLAKRAERCFRFELGLQDSSYIQFGYWDSLKKGLLSGEKLQYDLRRIESAYLEQNRREFELTKHISLVLLDPLALIKLRETGRCFFNLPEEIFDLDFPGHYFRRIKSVSITMPCVVGPYTTISCTLRLLKNSLRINTANGDNGYPRNTDDQGLPADDIRFIENNIPVKAIAASSAQNDSGVFELNFRDERYLPFEGAGVISQWSLELFNDLPSNNPDPGNPDFGRPLRQFDYSTISDAILHIKYSAREDAGMFKNGAIAHLRDYFSQEGATPSLRLFSLRQEFPTQWHRLLHPADPASGNIFELEMSLSNFPLRDMEKTLKVNTIWLLARCTDPGSYNVVMTPPLPEPPPDGSNMMSLAPVNQYGGLHFNQKDVTAQGIEVVPTDPPVKWQLKMTRPGGGNLQEDPVKKVIEVEDVWLVLGYEWEE